MLFFWTNEFYKNFNEERERPHMKGQEETKKKKRKSSRYEISPCMINPKLQQHSSRLLQVRTSLVSRLSSLSFRFPLLLVHFFTDFSAYILHLYKTIEFCLRWESKKEKNKVKRHRKVISENYINVILISVEIVSVKRKVKLSANKAK